MFCTVNWRSCAGYTKRRPLFARNVGTTRAGNRDHAPLSMLCAVLPRFGSNHTEGRELVAVNMCTSLAKNVNHPVWSMLCAVFRFFGPKYDFLVHRLPITQIIPSKACCAQYIVVLEPALPNDGHLLHATWAHLELDILIMPSLA